MAALPQMAAAQDDGVFFDPGGPSDKEYAVPHEQARAGGDALSSGDAPSSGENGDSGGATLGGSGAEEGADGGVAPTGDAPDAAIFGEGVTLSKGNRSAGGQAEERSGSDSVVGVSPVSAETNFASGLGWFVLIAAGVLLAGAGLAHLFNVRARRPSS